MQALTGCDSVLSFFGIGKKMVFGVVKNKGSDRFKDLCNLVECDTEENFYDPSEKEFTHQPQLPASKATKKDKLSQTAAT